MWACVSGERRQPEDPGPGDSELRGRVRDLAGRSEEDSPHQDRHPLRLLLPLPARLLKSS